MRAQEDAAVGVDDRLGHGLALLLHPEGVVSGARGVAGRRVQGGEVVVVELDLGALGDAVAQTGEDVLDLAHRLADEVLVTGREGDTGEGDVEALVLEGGAQGGLLELGLALLDQRLEDPADHVAALAEQRAVLGRRRRDRAQHLGERALAAEHGDADLLERHHVARLEDRGAPRRVQSSQRRGALLEDLQLLVVHGHPFSGAGGRRCGTSAAPDGRRRVLSSGAPGGRRRENS